MRSRIRPRVMPTHHASNDGHTWAKVVDQHHTLWWTRHAMRNLLCLLVVLAGVTASAQRRLPFEFDAGLPQNVTLTAQKVTALNSAMPAWVQLPSTFEPLQAGPQGATTPTVTLWFAPEMKAQFLRTLDAGDPAAANAPGHSTPSIE